MKSFFTQILMMFVAIMFLLKGGLSLVVGAWKFVLPALAFGGAYYFFKKSMQEGIAGNRSAEAKGNAQNARYQAAEPAPSPVIEICPVCLSEVGSCPKCRKKKKS